MRQRFVVMALVLAFSGSQAAPFFPSTGTAACAMCRKDCCCASRSAKGPAGCSGLIGPCSRRSDRPDSQTASPASILDPAALPPAGPTIAPTSPARSRWDDRSLAPADRSGAPSVPPPRITL